MTFKEFGLSPAIMNALEEKGYQQPTPIQEQVIPTMLKGVDILASAQTGTGKTAAFCLPMLELLRTQKEAGIKALILAPTRELALQIFDNLRMYGKHLPLRSAVIFGGVSQVNQVRDIRRGVDILVATPGRLHDLMNQGIIALPHLKILVLDEADRMLDMGFIHDIRRLLRVIPAARQNVFLSATMPREVEDLVKTILKNPVKIAVQPKPQQRAQVSQSVYYVHRDNKRDLLKHVIEQNKMRTVIVFARTKHGADKIAKYLNRSGIVAEAFHGDKSQGARQRTLTNFKQNATRVLVATDIAARGIDIADLPFVINYELPETAETYTHRIGRTGRAGQTGFALSFCDNDERLRLAAIKNRFAGQLTIAEHPYHSL